MAWHFDETSGQHVTIGDDAALTLPDGDWTISGWVYFDDLTGSLFQYFFSWGTVASTPSFNWYALEAGAGPAQSLQMYLVDNDGTTINVNSGGADLSVAVWINLTIQRSGNTVTQYINGVASGNATDAAFDGVDENSSLYLGMREDNDANRRLGGSMAEWAKWDRALSTREIAALVKGFAPSFFPNSLSWYTPMIRAYQELKEALTVTNNSATVTDHPPMIYPSTTQVVNILLASGAITNLIQGVNLGTDLYNGSLI